MEISTRFSRSEAMKAMLETSNPNMPEQTRTSAGRTWRVGTALVLLVPLLAFCVGCDRVGNAVAKKADPYKTDATAAIEALEAIVYKLDAGISLNDLNTAITDSSTVVGKFRSAYSSSRANATSYKAVCEAWEALLEARKYWTEAIGFAVDDAIFAQGAELGKQLRDSKFQEFTAAITAAKAALQRGD